MHPRVFIKIINAYNSQRPHSSLDFKPLAIAHSRGMEELKSDGKIPKETNDWYKNKLKKYF